MMTKEMKSIADLPMDLKSGVTMITREKEDTSETLMVKNGGKIKHTCTTKELSYNDIDEIINKHSGFKQNLGDEK